MAEQREFERYYSKNYGIDMTVITDSRVIVSGYTEKHQLGRNLNIAFSAWKASRADGRISVEDKMDAARYRHMRDNARYEKRNGPGLYWYLPRGRHGRSDAEWLDDAIGAQIPAPPKEGE